MSTQKGCGLGCLTISAIALVLSIFFLNYASSIIALAIFIFPVAALVHYFMRNRLFFEKHGGKFWAGIIVVTMLLAIPLTRSLDTPATDDPENSELVDSRGNAGGSAATQHTADASFAHDAVYDENGIPKLRGPLCDYAGLFAEKEATELEKRLLAFENAEIPAQFVVLTLKKLPSGKTESAFAQEIGDAWRLGKEGVDNGLLLLFALEDRAVFLATGYGLEGELPDGKCGSLCRLAVPSFKKAEYANGIEQIVEGVDEVLNRNAYQERANATIDALLQGFPNGECFYDKSEHFTAEHQTRLKELLQQASENTKYNLHFLYLPQMYGLSSDQIADKAWERLKSTDPHAALLFYSLEGPEHGAAVRAPEGVVFPKEFHLQQKYSLDHSKEKEHFMSVGRIILEFEEFFTKKRPKGWWAFNFTYGICKIIYYILAFAAGAFILVFVYLVIKAIFTGESYSGGGGGGGFSSRGGGGYSGGRSGGGYSGGGGRFGGGGGGARW